MSIVWIASPLVKTMAWFWFSGLPSPSFGSPGSFIENISYRKQERVITKGAKFNGWERPGE
jgi:hypothetical protein